MSEPLAAFLRPKTLDDYTGQDHLLDEHSPLRKVLNQGKCHSMLFWGPPGTGKTTLAHIIANHVRAKLYTLSAVMAGVKDIRAVIADIDADNEPAIVFIDEIHRFNKAQQDALLPHVEKGLFYLIGATTENPSFEVNNALLSRCRVYTLKKLDNAALQIIANRGIVVKSKQLGKTIVFNADALNNLVLAADGDARQLLNFIDIGCEMVAQNSDSTITPEHIQAITQTAVLQYDKGGDWFYDHISALHKSVRSSDPDAALYWYCRMLEAGVDLKYIARRIIRMASEDVGNADPRALTLANDAAQAFERLGSPEGDLAIAQAIVYCASAPKSNAVYTAFKKAQDCVRKGGSVPIPHHLRNAPTKLMQAQGNAKGYQYDHDFPEGIAYTQQCLPESLQSKVFYQPVNRGLEIKISEKLKFIRQQRERV